MDLGDTITDSNEISNELNCYFAYVGNELASKFKIKLSYKMYLNA